MADTHATLHLSSPDETCHLAAAIGEVLSPGDTILLNGPVGAGKSLFARAVIQSLQTEPEDVPSPTFTLVQLYETGHGEIWHSDLYRIRSADEIEELGLFDAFETAICLIEWPDRLGEMAPQDALCLEFRTDEFDLESRHLTLTWSDQKWHARLRKLLDGFKK